MKENVFYVFKDDKTSVESLQKYFVNLNCVRLAINHNVNSIKYSLSKLVIIMLNMPKNICTKA